MIIQSKKTGQRVTMTRKKFETLKQVGGYTAGWTIISNEDEPEVQTKKILPKEIIDFSTIKQTKPKSKSKNGSR